MRHRLSRVAGGDGVAAEPGGQLVAGGVNLGGRQDPARALRQHEAVAERATQGGDVGLHGFDGGPRRLVAPQEFDERVGRHHRSAVQPEHGEDRAWFGAGNRDRQAVLPDLHGPENAQLHLLKRSHDYIVRNEIQRMVKAE